MLQGINWDGTIALAKALTIPVIASGGLASMADIERMMAPDAAILEGAITGRELGAIGGGGERALADLAEHAEHGAGGEGGGARARGRADDGDPGVGMGEGKAQGDGAGDRAIADDDKVVFVLVLVAHGAAAAAARRATKARSCSSVPSALTSTSLPRAVTTAIGVASTPAGASSFAPIVVALA